MSKQTFNYIESTLLKILSGNFLLSTILILNLLTLLSTLWTISKSDLLKQTYINKFISQRNDPLTLMFAKDVTVDTLLPRDSISFSKIKANRVSLTSGSQLNQLGLHMCQDSIIMQAQDFYVGSKPLDNVSLNIPTQFKIVEAKNGLTEVSTIKSITNPNKEKHLSVTSKGSLNLSGNRGLTVSGKNLNIISTDKITLKSRRVDLSMFAMKGAYLPNLMNGGEFSRNMNDKSEMRSNICIEKNSGLIDYCQTDRWSLKSKVLKIY